MWRAARPEDDNAIVAMCAALNAEDPGPLPVPDTQTRHTLDVLRREPHRGRAIVLELEGKPAGYALLISFWSNELGGEVCEIDELYVVPEQRGRGHGRALFAGIERGELWPSHRVAMALIVRDDNARAKRLYARLGFGAAGISMARRL
jgi:ribosomal protein S18 acetylase RimI-like enzyme